MTTHSDQLQTPMPPAYPMPAAYVPPCPQRTHPMPPAYAPHAPSVRTILKKPSNCAAFVHFQDGLQTLFSDVFKYVVFQTGGRATATTSQRL